ncbi:MAG: hypothetical protein ACK5MU_01520 [Candidatus Saccharimonadales bacterium]
MSKYDEKLLAEIQSLNENIASLADILRLVYGILDGEKSCDAGEQEELSPWRDLDIPYKLLCKLEYRGIRSLEQLVEYSRAELISLKRGLTDEQARRVAVALGKMKMHLREEKIYETSDEVAESPDIERDDAMILEALEELGYSAWDLYDDGQKWAFEAVRFAVNNPKISREYKTYLWPVIAKRENVTVADVTKLVGDSVKSMKPRWKELLRMICSCDERESEMKALAEKVFVLSYGCPTSHKSFIFELRDIGLYVREKRRLEDIEISRKNGEVS